MNFKEFKDFMQKNPHLFKDVTDGKGFKEFTPSKLVSKWPTNWEEQAKQYKISDVFDVSDPVVGDNLNTMFSNGFVVIGNKQVPIEEWTLNVKEYPWVKAEFTYRIDPKSFDYRHYTFLGIAELAFERSLAALERIHRLGNYRFDNKHCRAFLENRGVRI